MLSRLRSSEDLAQKIDNHDLPAEILKGDSIYVNNENNIYVMQNPILNSGFR